MWYLSFLLWKLYHMICISRWNVLISSSLLLYLSDILWYVTCDPCDVLFVALETFNVCQLTKESVVSVVIFLSSQLPCEVSWRDSDTKIWQVLSSQVKQKCHNSPQAIHQEQRRKAGDAVVEPVRLNGYDKITQKKSNCDMWFPIAYQPPVKVFVTVTATS